MQTETDLRKEPDVNAIHKIWLSPPLAFARLGSAPEACDNFDWGAKDLEPEGTARQSLVAATTMRVDDQGFIHTSHPESIQFKDGARFRPVSPFFELCGEWQLDGQDMRGPITESVLARFGLSSQDLDWRVTVANRKAWRYTKDPGDIIQATIRLQGHERDRLELRGSSPEGARHPLVHAANPVSLGHVQLTQAQDEIFGLRLRFTPPQGTTYAPTNLHERLGQLAQTNFAIEQIIAATIRAAIDSIEAFFEAFVADLPEGDDRVARRAMLDQARVAAKAQTTGLLQFLSGKLIDLNKRWSSLQAEGIRPILNPDAAWAKFGWPRGAELDLRNVLGKLLNGEIKIDESVLGSGEESPLLRMLVPPEADTGNLPVAVFAFIVEAQCLISSLGMIDDTSDGVIEVKVPKHPHLQAHARVVVTPPSVVPDRRMPITIADGLADRARRREPITDAEADEEVFDLMNRAFEAVGLQNADAVADFFRCENVIAAGTDPADIDNARRTLWHDVKDSTTSSAPLTHMARKQHRRLATRLALESFARANPRWVEGIRPVPDSPHVPYDKRMPALMRGGDRTPLHLTRRQIDLLHTWTWRIANAAPAPASAPSPASNDGGPA